MSSVAQEYDTVQVLKSTQRGTVSLVRHKRTHTKFVFRDYIGNADVYKKLLTVSCPYLPQIMEVGCQGDRAAVLEEYIQGDSLDFLLEGALFTPAQTRRIALQLCEALWVLHSFGAVHRDVKPENVILRGDQAVLIDFDASRLVKDANCQDTQVLGTTGFAAPEQYGIAQTDCRTDIYALGILMNLLCTGKHPSVELAGGRLGRVIQKCTMISPERRYQNVLALMEAL